MKSIQLSQFFSHITQQLEKKPDEAHRLFHGRGRCWEGLEQLTCDWLQGHMVVALFKPVEQEFINTLKAGLSELSNQPIWTAAEGKSMILQHRYQNGAPVEVLSGELAPFPVVQESGLKYQLQLGKNQNSGLFLDMHYGRNWVREQTQGKCVLNLFAYTCGFSVAAIEGGAEKVVNVDMAKSSLSRGRDNHRLNGHDLSCVSFLPHDIFKSWGKIRKAGPYDLVIIDPPSFQKGSFALTTDYRKILRRLPELLNSHAKVLACVNSPSVTSQFLIDLMQQEAPKLTFVKRLSNPPGFADLDEEASLKALVFKHN